MLLLEQQITDQQTKRCKWYKHIMTTKNT